MSKDDIKLAALALSVFMVIMSGAMAIFADMNYATWVMLLAIWVMLVGAIETK